MRKFAKKGMLIKNMEFVSENIIIFKVQKKCDADTLFIVNRGLSMSVDNENCITHYDPFLTISDEKEYSKRLDGDVAEMYFTFSSEGLDISGKELVGYIYNCAGLRYRRIVLIGHSKAGVCFANASKMIDDESISMILISAPFNGTIIADKKEMEKRMSKGELKVYNKIFNNHAVDKDLIPNSDFMCQADYSGVKTHKCLNIVSIIKTPYSIKDVGCKCLGKIAGLDSSDGVVSMESQSALEIPRTIYINASHATSLDRALSGNLDRYVL